MIQLKIIKYTNILLIGVFLNIFDIYSDSCCKKCKAYCEKLCQGSTQDPSDSEINELKEYLFGTIFRPGFENCVSTKNFVFHDYIKVEQLVDTKILQKIGKTGSSNIYTFTIDIDNKIFKTEDYELSDKDYITWGTKDRPNLKISKKNYEEDKKNNKYTYLRNGRVDSKQYGTIIYYIQSEKIYVYCKDIKKKLFKTGQDSTDFFYGDNNKVDVNNCEVTKYIENNSIVDKEKQVSKLVRTEYPGNNTIVLTFYKEKNK